MTFKKILYANIAIALFCVVANADTTTTRLGLTKPSVGSAGWGTKWNTNADTIDAGAAIVGATNTFTAAQTFTGGMVVSSKITGVTAGTVSGDVLTFTQRKIVQVVNARTTTSTSTASTAFVNSLTSATITPTSAANRIMIIVNGNGEIAADAIARTATLTLSLNGANLETSDGISSFAAPYTTGTGNWPFTYSFLYTISAGVTTPITYGIQMKSSNAGSTVHLPRSGVALPQTMVLIEYVP